MQLDLRYEILASNLSLDKIELDLVRFGSIRAESSKNLKFEDRIWVVGDGSDGADQGKFCRRW